MISPLEKLVFDDLKQAMRDKDVLTKGVLTILKANLDSATKEKKRTLTLEEAMNVVRKELKQIGQSYDAAVKANRDDIIANESMKRSILERYLPEQLDDDAIKTILINAGITSGMNMGDAMTAAKTAINGRAENGKVSMIVRQIIAGK